MSSSVMNPLFRFFDLSTIVGSNLVIDFSIRVCKTFTEKIEVLEGGGFWREGGGRIRC